MKRLLMDMPCTVRGFVKKSVEPDGEYYTVVINSRLSQELQRRAIRHEECHVDFADFDNESADTIEGVRHETNSHIHPGEF